MQIEPKQFKYNFLNFFGVVAANYKLLLIAVCVLILASICSFFAGTRKGRGWADNAYLQEREARREVITKHETEAAIHLEGNEQLAAENAFLRAQAKMASEILKKNDAKIIGDTKKFTEFVEERNKKIKEIRLDDDYDNQLCSLCKELKQSGFELSREVCGRCAISK